MSDLKILSNELRSLTAGGEPNRHQFHKMPLDELEVNQKLYFSIVKLGTERGRVEAIIDFRQRQEVSIFEAGNCLAVLDHKATMILYAASHSEWIWRDRACASDLQQWRRGFVDLYDRANEIKASAPSVVITYYLAPKIPVLATLSGPSSRFWWHRVHDAFEAGYIVYDASDGQQPCNRCDLIDRNVAKAIISVTVR